MSSLVNVDINGTCNLSCSFCYQDLDGSELSKEEVLELAGPASVVEIGGGEPFLHGEFLDIIKELREKGKRVHISTNGAHVPEEFLALEDKLREDIEVQISLHASNPELYEKIAGKNVFDAVIENIKKINLRYTALITSAVFQDNFDDVSNIVDLAGGLGLPIRVNLVYPIGKGKDVKLITPEQVDRLTGYLLAQRLQKFDDVDSPLLHTNNCLALEKYYGIPKQSICPADCGTKQYISPRKVVFPCEFLQDICGDSK